MRSYVKFRTSGGRVKSLFGEAGIRILAVLALLLGLILAFFVIRILVVPFVVALFVVYLADPAILALQRHGLDRGRAFLLLIFLTFVVLTILLMLMPSWLRFESIAGSSETFSQRFAAQLNALEGLLNANFPMLRSANIADQITAKAAAVASLFFGELPGLITAFM